MERLLDEVRLWKGGGKAAELGAQVRCCRGAGRLGSSAVVVVWRDSKVQQVCEGMAGSRRVLDEGWPDKAGFQKKDGQK